MTRIDDADELVRIYRALGHPLRRDIIKYLGEHGKASFTELKRNLKVSVGTLYYNLDQLKDLVTQDPDKKYVLTKRGQVAYNLMKRDQEHLILYEGLHNEKMTYIIRILYPIFFPKWFTYLIMNNRMLIPAAVFSLAIGLLTSTMSRLELSIMFYYIATTTSFISLGVKYLFSWVSIFLLSDIISWILQGRHRGHFKLMLAIAVAMMPLAIYPTIHVIIMRSLPEYPVFMGISFRRLFLGLILILLQLMTICYLASSLNQIKRLEIERAFIVASIIYYINMVFNMLIKQFIALPTIFAFYSFLLIC